MAKKAVIVGCGIAGATAAFLLKQKGYRVEIFETRNHIAGNCYDEEVHGVTVHKYGAHVFHTNRDKVWSFVNRFAKFNDFCPKVWANTKEGLIPIPYNDITKTAIGEKSKDQIIDLIFRDYSEKMWGESWENLPGEITSRIPKIREGTNRCYHKDPYFGVPIGGYVKMFENMLEGVKVLDSLDGNLVLLERGLGLVHGLLVSGQSFPGQVLLLRNSFQFLAEVLKAQVTFLQAQESCDVGRH